MAEVRWRSRAEVDDLDARSLGARAWSPLPLPVSAELTFTNGEVDHLEWLSRTRP